MSLFRCADLEIDLEAAVVRCGGNVLPVTDRSFELLRELVSRAPQVVSHRELLDAVWPGRVVSPETLKQRVLLLRQALGAAPGSSEYIVSVHGRGYRMGYPVQEPCAEAVSPGRRWARIIVAALAAVFAAWMVSWLIRDEPLPPPAASETVDARPAEAPPAPRPDTAEEPP